MGWPELLQALVNCLDSNNLNHMEGAIDALSKVGANLQIEFKYFNFLALLQLLMSTDFEIVVLLLGNYEPLILNKKRLLIFILTPSITTFEFVGTNFDAVPFRVSGFWKRKTF